MRSLSPIFGITAALVILQGGMLIESTAQSFEAPLHEATWLPQSSVFECTISQRIPLFGEARFHHRAGEKLKFEIQAFDTLRQLETLTLYSLSPPWKPSDTPVELGTQQSERADRIRFGQATAQRIIAELLAGRVPAITADALLRDEVSASIALSPIRFQFAYGEYQQCSNNLLPVNFDQIQRNTLFWPSGARTLSAESMARLDDIISYAKADPSIVGFEVDSFTDTAGERRENLLFSEERAFLVTNYLIVGGINPEQIATRAHGEREEYLIVNPEKNEADRNRNRRVNIVLLRDLSLISKR